MELRTIIAEFIIARGHPLPKDKVLEDAIDVFILGQNAAGWSWRSYSKYTNHFTEKTPKRQRAYVWALESLSKKYCTTCEKVHNITNFSKDKNKANGYASKCKDCEASKHKTYYLTNLEHCLATSKKHYEENKHMYVARSASRRAAELNATPQWSEVLEIATFYSNRPEGYHVDHVIPLQNKLVCGLHVIGNLQYLKAKENLIKSNNFNIEGSHGD